MTGLSDSAMTSGDYTLEVEEAEVAREVYDFHAWLTVWRWGVGIAFSGLVIRIARFLYLW